MNAQITAIHKLRILIKREFWEYRLLFLLVPLCCLIVSLSFSVTTARAVFLDTSPLLPFGANQLPGESAADALARFAEAPTVFKERFWNQFYESAKWLSFLVYWGVMIYYFLMTLYQQRKDRSILFWNSMPVSDTLTVTSKLLAGLVLVHGVFLVTVFFINLVLMLTLSAYAMFVGVDVWETIIAPANLLGRFFWSVPLAFLSVFWCLPVYAWFLLASAWAKSAPLAWASAPFVLISVPELIMTNKSEVLIMLIEHILPSWSFDSGQSESLSRISFVFGPEMLVSVLLGIGLIVAAIVFNRSEDN